jgi:AcrR family transcriptional regulator
MGTETRRMAPEARRAQLLDVLADLVLAEGYEAVSIDRVAREGRVARTVVYAQFGNLQGLLEALLERTQRRAVEQVQAIVVLAEAPAPEDIDGLIVDAVRTFGRIVLDDPRTWRLALLPADGAPAILRERTEAARGAIRAIVQPVVAWLLSQRGAPSGIDEELAAHAIVALGEDGAKLTMSDPVAYPPERMAEFAGALLRAFKG